MNLGTLRARRPRLLATAVLLPALAFRLLVPAGFMPVVGDGLSVSMQMCHGDARSAAVIRLVGQGTPAGDRPGAPTARHEAPCVFAATASAAPAPALVILPTALETSAPATLPPEHVPALPLRHCPQSPRAPPLTV